MTLTAFPNGVSSFGIPVFGTIPAIKGTYFFVEPTIGSDGNKGDDASRPLKSFKKAYDLCTDKAGDGIVIFSHGNTSADTSSYLLAELTWDKSDITMVGICSGSMFSQRARIANDSTLINAPEIITMSGNNNLIVNVSFVNAGSDAAAIGGIKVTGQRNNFYNCHIAGALGATPAVVAAAHNLELNGAQENTFERCVIGVDTISRVGDVANYDILLTGGCLRNVFKDCIIKSQTTSGNSSHLAIKFGGAGDGISANHYFINCIFDNFNLGALSAQTSMVGGTLPNNGKLVLKQPTIIGYTAIDSVGAATAYTDIAASGATGGIVTGG